MRAWLSSYAAFAWLRLASGSAAVPGADILAVTAASVEVYVALAVPLRLHQGRAPTASLEEVVLLGMLMGGAGGGSSSSTRRRSGSPARVLQERDDRLGGSICSELCRQIHRYEPAELMILDRDESALRRIFATRRPDVVFHAAALKHLPMLEQYPAEAVKTNVIGTRTVLDAADLVGVDKFVNISTDKAANPCSVLGWSKRVAERITAERALSSNGVYLSVRFGNVLGSRGSVLASFARQIAEGGPLTVTHPDVSRFFMTIEEACQLVIQAAAIGAPGEALVLDMGEPVRIVDMAKQLIQQSGTPVSIEFTGLREGEKMHEELFADDEPRDIRPRHPLVSHVPVPPITDERVLALPTTGLREEVRSALESASHVTDGLNDLGDYASPRSLA